MMRKVLKGIEWSEYLRKKLDPNIKQEQIYVCSHNYTPIYKAGEYYFCFKIRRGYKNLASLKRLI